MAAGLLKYNLLFLLVSILLLLLDHPAPIWGKKRQDSDEDDEDDCTVAFLKTQEDFDLGQYGGAWYVISDSGLFPYQHTLDRIFYLYQDVKTYHYIDEEETGFKVRTAGRYLFRCGEGEGEAKIVDPEKDPAKFTISFPESWIPWGKEETPYWVMATDYEYAVVFSCRKLEREGHCNRKSLFVWTLNRDPDGHSPAQQAAIDDHLERLCVDPASMVKMPRRKPCPEIEEPKEGGEADKEEIEEDEDEEDSMEEKAEL